MGYRYVNVWILNTCILDLDFDDDGEIEFSVDSGHTVICTNGKARLKYSNSDELVTIFMYDNKEDRVAEGINIYLKG